MKTVRYELSNPWVGRMQCPACQRTALCWRSSGMSESFPHFYCDTCSNAILRGSDHFLVRGTAANRELLDRIAATLPGCPCGGRFRPGANPKCPHCGNDYTHQGDPVARLSDPHVILLSGACMFGDADADHEPYRVLIDS